MKLRQTENAEDDDAEEIITCLPPTPEGCVIRSLEEVKAQQQTPGGKNGDGPPDGGG